MCCWFSLDSVFCAFLWHVGRWHFASSLHTTHSSIPEHVTARSTVGSLKSTCLSVNNDTKLPPIWGDSRSKTSSVIPHRVLSSCLLSFLFTSHHSSASHPSSPLPLWYYVPFFLSCLFSVLNNHQRHNPFPQLSATPVMLSFHPSPPVLSIASSYWSSSLHLHHPWSLSLSRCTNFLWQ